MSFSTHPQNLTKDRLREDLENNGIQLPSGKVMKRVLVDLYIRHLTPWHKDQVVEERSEFSDDEPLTPKKSPRKKVVKMSNPDVESLTDSELFAKLSELGATPGPITDTTRQLYRRKLTKLLANPKQLQTEEEEVVVEEEVEEYSDDNADEEEEEEVVEEIVEEPITEEETVVLVDDNGHTKTATINTVTTTTTTTTTVKKRAGKTTVQESQIEEAVSVTNGHPVATEEPKTDADKEKPATKERSSRKVMYMFLFLLLLAILGALLFYHMEDNPSRGLPNFNTKPAAKAPKV